ncbi:MAG: arginine--tRNA ligase [Burkholderiales bacterium]
MSVEIKAHLLEILSHALATVLPDEPATQIALERTKQLQHGDYTSSIAMQLARSQRRNPRELAQSLVAALPASQWLESAEVAGAGFINLKLRVSAKQQVVSSVLAQGESYGHQVQGNGLAILLEFVSANPTGPLHVGHGRQAALGDSLAKVLNAQGYRVTREFYYNDAGAQIHNLALSVQARAREFSGESAPFPADGYHGEYIREIAQKFIEKNLDRIEDLDAIREFAVKELRAEQDLDLKAFGVIFDNYYLESSLYQDGRVDAAVEALRAAQKTYEKDGALWLKTTDYGDDKDRVMRKSDGSYTYFVPDVAYHIGKWERGFTRAINIQGSDHHSTVTRVRAGLQACGRGIPQGYPDYLLHKMVTVMRGGEEVKISKRAGTYVTLRYLIDEVGCDATRFFLVSRKPDTEFVFDIDLAKSKSEENPVYYVQYAHARVCSVLDQWRAQFPLALAPSTTEDEEEFFAAQELISLESKRELALLGQLDQYPEVLGRAASELAPHYLAFYLRELAAEFHGYYNAERFLVAEENVRHARLALAIAVRRVLRNGLALLGVSAPRQM